MNNTPKVSVVIATYNRASLLHRAIHSVLVQTFTNHELIIIDDGSTDYTQHVVAEFNDPRIHYFKNTINQGQAAARNLGISYARGEYIAFLDDDDECVPTRLENQVAFLDASPAEIGMVYGWMDKYDDSTHKLEHEYGSGLSGDVFELALTGRNIAVTITMLVRTSVAREVGGFDERLSIGEDPLFVCNISSKYRIGFQPKVVCIRHIKHGYPRMTEPSESQRLGMDKYLRVHIQTFSTELEQRPRLFADVLRWSSIHSMECRYLKRAVSISLKAFRLHPLNPSNVRHVLRLAKVFVFYVSPISRYRNQAQSIQRALGLRQERDVVEMIGQQNDGIQ